MGGKRCARLGAWLTVSTHQGASVTGIRRKLEQTPPRKVAKKRAGKTPARTGPNQEGTDLELCVPRAVPEKLDG